MHSRYIRAILAVILVTGVASASFYISSKISNQKSVSLSSPDSTPLAAKLESEEAAFINKSKSTKKAAAIVTTKPTSATVRNNPILSKDDRDEIAAERAAIASKAVSPTVNATPAQSTSTYNPTAFLSPSATPIITAAPAAAIPTPKPGTFGSTATDTQKSNISYMSDKANDCTDGLGFVSGTGCFNGERRVLGNADTQQAYQQHVQAVKNDLITLTTEQILAKAGKTCDPAVQNCQKIIEESQKIVFNQNVVLGEDQIELGKIRNQTQALKDVQNAASKTYLQNTYGTEDPKAILNQLGVDPVLAQQAVDNRNAVLARAAADAKRIADAKIIEEAKKTINAKLPENIKNYTDPTISDAVLAIEYCKGKLNTEICESYFRRTDIISGLDKTSIDYQKAITDRQKNLSNLIPLVVGSSTLSNVTIDTKTRQEIIKLNEDTAHAFWVYTSQNSARQHAGVTSDQLAKEFNDKLDKDPSLLNKNIALYNSQPKQYDKQFSNYQFAKEENPLIIAKYNEIIKNQTIPGLTNQGVPNSYEKLAPEYQKTVMDKACDSNSALYEACSFVKLNEGNPNTISSYNKNMATINAAIKANETLYVSQIIKEKNTLLSTYGSNIIDINNANIGNSDINKAKEVAKTEELKDSLFNPKYGFGNMAGTSIVIDPTIRNTIPEPSKWTKEQKDAVANQYLAEQKVIETYNRGTGVAGAVGTAALATALCAELGPGAIACGAAGGLAAAVSNFVPILGRSTAAEIATEQQNIKNFEVFGKKVFNNDTAAGLVQSLYSNQGAACSTEDGIKIGASCTTKDNAFALLSNIQSQNHQNSTTVSSLADSSTQASIAVQPFLNQQFDALQNENQRQAYLNIAIAPVMGAISASVGVNIANATNKNIITNFLVNQSASLGNSLIGAAQAEYQFKNTVGFVDTQSETALAICIKQYGNNSSQCKEIQTQVANENSESEKNNLIMAVVSDQVIDKVISVGSFAQEVSTKFNTNTPTNTVEVSNTPQTKQYQGDSVMLSPQLARELNNIDPNIIQGSERLNLLPKLTEAEYQRKLNKIEFATNDRSLLSSKRNGLDSDLAPQILMEDVQQITDEFNLRNSRTEITPEDDLLIARVAEDRRVQNLTNTPAESLQKLTELQRQDLNNLASKIGDPATPQDLKEVYTLVLKSQTDRYVNSNESSFVATPVRANADDVALLADITGLQSDFLNQVTDGEVTALRPLMEEFNSPDTDSVRKSAIVSEIVTKITSPEDSTNFIVPSELAAINKPVDLNNLPDPANDPFIVPADPDLSTPPQTPLTSPVTATRSTRSDTTPPPAPRKPNKLTETIASAIKPPDATERTKSTFKPNDNIHQSIPGDSNVIGKVPDLLTSDNQPVYYRTSEIENGVTTRVSDPIRLSDNNLLPADGKPYLLEFGTIDSNENFIKIKPKPIEGTQTLAINVSNEYSFGKPDSADHTPKPKTNPIKTGVQTAKNAVATLPEKAGLPAATKPPQTSPTTNSITQRIKVLFTENLPQVSSRLKLTEQEILTLNYLEELRITKAKNNQDLNNFSESTPTGDRTPLIRNAEDDIKALAQKYKDLGLDINQDAPSRPIGLTDTGEAILKIKEFLSDNIPSTAKVKPQAEASPKTPTSTKPTAKKVLGLGTDEATARYLYELEGLKNKGRGQMSESSKLDPDTNFGPYNEVLVRQALELAEKYGITLRPGSFDPIGQSSISIAIQKLKNIFADPRPDTSQTTNPVKKVIENVLPYQDSTLAQQKLAVSKFIALQEAEYPKAKRKLESRNKTEVALEFLAKKGLTKESYVYRWTNPKYIIDGNFYEGNPNSVAKVDNIYTIDQVHDTIAYSEFVNKNNITHHNPSIFANELPDPGINVSAKPNNTDYKLYGYELIKIKIGDIIDRGGLVYPDRTEGSDIPLYFTLPKGKTVPIKIETVK